MTLSRFITDKTKVSHEISAFKAAISGIETDEISNYLSLKISAAVSLYFDDKHFMAYKQILIIREALEMSTDECKESHRREILTEILQTLINSKDYQSILTKYKQGIDLLTFIYSDDGWTLLRENNKVRTLYRVEANISTAGTPASGDAPTLHTFKLTGTINANILRIAAVIYEIDLYKNWFPMLNFSHIAGTVSRYHRMAQLEVFVPWPFENRDVVVDGFGYDLLEEHGSVLIYLESIWNLAEVVAEHGELLTFLPIKKGTVRCDVKLGGFLLEILSREETRVSVVFNADPKIDVIPKWLLNWGTSKVVHWILGYIETAANFDPKGDSVYAKRMQSNPEVYAYAETILEAAYEKL